MLLSDVTVPVHISRLVGLKAVFDTTSDGSQIELDRSLTGTIIAIASVEGE